MDTKTVFITGASGFLGQVLLGRLINTQGYAPRAAYRLNRMGVHSQVESVRVGDIGEHTDWAEALSGVNCVVHLAARVHVMQENSNDALTAFRQVNVSGTINLARQAIAAGVSRFIFMSSIKVNGEQTGAEVPFSPDDQPAPKDPYAISKWEAEQQLLKLAEECSMEVVIIRPALVYGPGVKANFLSMMSWLASGWPLPLGSIHNKRSLIAIDNLVDLILICIEHPAAANQVFLAADGEDISTTELLLRMGDALGKPVHLFPVPAWLLEVVAALVGKRSIAQRLCGSLQVDISKTQDLLGWTPPVDVDAALRKTAIAFRSNQDC